VIENLEQVVLVDTLDNTLGVCEKIEAHQNGLLHRAFSIFLFNDKKEWLLQQRANSKYHSDGLWSNTCCSHPRPNENIENAAKRRLTEEVNLSVSLKKEFSFQYKHKFENELIENELDYIFTGFTNDIPQLNPDEVQDLKFMPFDFLHDDVLQNPEKYTVWFKLIYLRVWSVINQ